MESKPHLFPHSWIPERAAGRLVSLFGPVWVHMPWHMDIPGFFKDLGMETTYPPEDLRPGQDLKAVLSGYHSWAGLNPDRSSREVLKVTGGSMRDDAAIWDLRRHLKGVAQHAPERDGQDLTLRYHLLLHLAADVEKGYFDIMAMMGALKKKGPLLAGAINDPDDANDAPGDMDYLAGTDPRDNMDIGSILDAWFGLFSAYIGRQDLLITHSRGVMDHISSRWDEACSGVDISDRYSISFSLPECPSVGNPGGDTARIMDLTLGLGHDTDHKIDELRRITGKRTDLLPLKGSRIFIRYFPLLSLPAVESGAGGICTHISGKTIVLMEHDHVV